MVKIGKRNLNVNEFKRIWIWIYRADVRAITQIGGMNIKYITEEQVDLRTLLAKTLLSK